MTWDGLRRAGCDVLESRHDQVKVSSYSSINIVLHTLSLLQPQPCPNLYDAQDMLRLLFALDGFLARKGSSSIPELIDHVTELQLHVSSFLSI